MTSGERLHAALSWVAAQAASSAVAFNVVHTGPETPTPAGLTPPTAPDRLATETMTFRAAGAGFRVYTWVPDAPVGPANGAPATHLPAGADHLYSGRVMINPGRTLDPAQSIEVLVSLGHDPWSPGYGDALMVARASQELTRAAAEHDVPVLFLQSPVSPFRNTPRQFRADGSGEAPRVPNALALRMVLGAAAPAKRMDAFVGLTAIARRNGFGLDVTDRRLGRVKGQWWTVLRADQQVYESVKREHLDWAPVTAPESVLLCTVLGPERTGSAAAITSDLTARNVGIAAVSAVSLHGIAFVNLVLPVAPVWQAGADPAGSVAAIADGLGAVATRCGLTKADAVRGRSRIGAGPAADYTVLTSGPFPVAAPPADTDRPLWMSWSLHADAFPHKEPDLPELLLAQLATEPELVGGARIDHQRSRVTPDRRITGRAKLTLSLATAIGQVHLPATLTALCERVQREIIASLVRHGIPLHTVEIALDWRERWTR